MWFLFSQQARRKSRIHPLQRLRTLRMTDYALSRQREELNVVKREHWTEADLDSLPAGEPDAFDRKSGRLFDKQDEFFNKVAKALSAFANSGGGSLILGVTDDGTPDGLPTTVGRTPMRDWLEQKVPTLLDYPLSDFRVHVVVRDNASRIPSEKEVIVIDVGDSAAAPHQSKRDKCYYRREAGHSVPAPHFYLELLRQRLTNPVLELSLRSFEPVEAYEHENGLFVGAWLKFEVSNVGRVAAYDWQLNCRQLANDKIPQERLKSDFRFQKFPKGDGSYSRGTPINKTILPGCNYWEWIAIGIQLRPRARAENAVLGEIETMIAGLTLFFQIATETSPGELQPVALAAVIDTDELLVSIRQKGLEFFGF
jgi:hypothetical protein